jgi:hypothetical protein
MANPGFGEAGGLAERPAPPEFSIDSKSRVEPLSSLVDDSTFERFLTACTRAISPHYADADIRMRTMPVSKSYPLMRKVEQRRVRRARELLSSMRQRRVLPYCPFALEVRPGSGVWLIYPPLVELHPKRALVINGHHRLIAAREAELKRVQVIAIEHVSARAPASPALWDDVGVAKARSSDHSDVVVDLRKDLVRPSASFCRSRYFHFAAFENLVGWCEWLANSDERWIWNPDTHLLERSD